MGIMLGHGPAASAGTAFTNHLLSDHDDRLDAEPPVAVVEEILQRGS